MEVPNVFEIGSKFCQGGGGKSKVFSKDQGPPSFISSKILKKKNNRLSLIEIFKNQNSEFDNKRNPDFNDLDDEFYDLDGLEKLQVDYIRKNYEKFIVE